MPLERESSKNEIKDILQRQMQMQMQILIQDLPIQDLPIQDLPIQDLPIQDLPDVPENFIIELERAAFNSSVLAFRAAARGGATHETYYEAAMETLRNSMVAHIGPFPDDIGGLKFMNGGISAADLVSGKVVPLMAPRDIGRRLFVRALINADPAYKDRAKTLETATAIEVSCFNAAVRLSKESAEPPRRHWDSPAFVDTYSTRCGAVYSALDPASTSCKVYGPQLIPRILNGELIPSALGVMTERDMCPPATEAERAEILSRSSQRVIEKESTLFLCPHCKARRCTYIEIQRRSLDEAPDYICTCLACRQKFTGRQ